MATPEECECIKNAVMTIRQADMLEIGWKKLEDTYQKQESRKGKNMINCTR